MLCVVGVFERWAVKQRREVGWWKMLILGSVKWPRVTASVCSSPETWTDRQLMMMMTMIQSLSQYRQDLHWPRGCLPTDTHAEIHLVLVLACIIDLSTLLRYRLRSRQLPRRLGTFTGSPESGDKVEERERTSCQTSEDVDPVPTWYAGVRPHSYTYSPTTVCGYNHNIDLSPSRLKIDSG